MNYDSFYLVPRMSVVKSRSECDTSVIFGGHKFSLPIMPSNMATVVDFGLCEELARRNYFYVMHRFVSYDMISDFVAKMRDLNLVSSISVGVKAKDYFLVDYMAKNGLSPDFTTLDVAHVDSILGRDMIKYIKKVLPNTFLIAGNIGSVDGAKRVESWGASAIKIGIGSGSICDSSINTGFHGSPVELLKSIRVNIPLIADGGATVHGDIAKALTLGSTMIMSGGFFSGMDESPSKTVMIDGESFKEYHGSTALNTTHKEGHMKHIPTKGSIWDAYRTIKENLQSSISYAGGKDLRAFNKVAIKHY